MPATPNVPVLARRRRRSPHRRSSPHRTSWPTPQVLTGAAGSGRPRGTGPAFSCARRAGSHVSPRPIRPALPTPIRRIVRFAQLRRVHRMPENDYYACDSVNAGWTESPLSSRILTRIPHSSAPTATGPPIGPCAAVARAAVAGAAQLWLAPGSCGWHRAAVAGTGQLWLAPGSCGWHRAAVAGAAVQPSLAAAPRVRIPQFRSGGNPGRRLRAPLLSTARAINCSRGGRAR